MDHYSGDHRSSPSRSQAHDAVLHLLPLSTPPLPLFKLSCVPSSVKPPMTHPFPTVGQYPPPPSRPSLAHVYQEPSLKCWGQPALYLPVGRVCINVYLVSRSPATGSESAQQVQLCCHKGTVESEASHEAWCWGTSR